MNISLSEEQQQAATCRESTHVFACPGSGKTRLIASKIQRVATELSGSPFRVACITYTNAAVFEIENRLRRICSSPAIEASDVCTIHSFCLNSILRPYAWLHAEVPEGFSIVSPDSPEFDDLVRIIRPKATLADMDAFSGIRQTASGDLAGPALSSGDITESEARQFNEIILSSGYLSFPMILFYSFQIIKLNPFVCEGLSARYPWILVDEFQDTSDIQIEILRLIAKSGSTRFFCVGDLNQSITSFAGARPDLASRFAEEIAGTNSFPLSINFRCSKSIVQHAEKLIPCTPPMKSRPNAPVGEVRFSKARDVTREVLDYFVPASCELGISYGEMAILAPWWPHLVPIGKGLRHLDIPCVGPGARPYKRSHLVSDLAESISASIVMDSAESIRRMEKAVAGILEKLNGYSDPEIFSLSGRILVLQMREEARAFMKARDQADTWLLATSDHVAKVLVEAGLLLKTHRSLLIDSAKAIIEEMTTKGENASSMSVAELGLLADTSNAIKLLTLHSSKGREFKSVALIYATEGKLPHYKSSTLDEIDEARRVFYVGMTRAEQFLHVICSLNHPKDRPSRFVREAGLI